MAELIIAFGAGLISFLSPCVLPLIPGYIAFISGSTFNELLEKKINLTPIVYFTLGFSIIFIIFGMAATFIGQLLLKNSNELRIIAGLIIIIFSLDAYFCMPDFWIKFCSVHVKPLKKYNTGSFLLVIGK